MTDRIQNRSAQVLDPREKIERHFQEFEQLLSLAKKSLLGGDREASAAYLQVAAYYAWFHPTGIFASPELEAILTQIGMSLSPSQPGPARIPQSPPKNILHILTEVHGLGGHTRMTWRWIQADAGRSHSVALTGQRAAGVPELLRAAVEKSGGTIHHLDRILGGLLSRAQELRRLSRDADQVVLHIHPYDVVPLIAFADWKQRPPLALLNHGDHVFWIGGSIADQIAQIRDSGIRLSESRRGISSLRSSLLPIPLDEKPRSLKRGVAKQKLGLHEDAVVLLTIASPYKYSAAAGEHFTDLVLPVVKKYPNVTLLVIGPTEREEWTLASRQTDGRVKAFGRRADTEIFYQAADVYLDSFPFSSLTSFLEAGSYGTPIVSYCSHAPEAEVMCGDDPGLSQLMKRPRNAEDFRKDVSELVEHDDLRIRLGALTKESIREWHMNGGWNRSLEELYARCHSASRERSHKGCETERQINELDLQLTRFFEISGLSRDLAYLFRNTVGVFPFGRRLRIWKDVLGARWRHFPCCFLSDWQKVWLKLIWSRLKGRPTVSRTPNAAALTKNKRGIGRLNERLAEQPKG